MRGCSISHHSAERDVEVMIQVLKFVDFSAQVSMFNLQVEQPGLKVRRGRRAHLLGCAVALLAVRSCTVGAGVASAGIEVVLDHGDDKRCGEMVVEMGCLKKQWVICAKVQEQRFWKEGVS